MQAIIRYGDADVAVDLADALSLAVPLDFDGPQPNAFGVAPATAQAIRGPDFSGDTRNGGSVNCEQLSLTPHGNGTHTECIGHVTDERIAVAEVLHGGLWLAAIVSVTPLAAEATGESSEPRPRPGDRLVTARALLSALDAAWPDAASRPALDALIVRTLPNGADKLSCRYAAEPAPPYFSIEAADFLVSRGIRHVVTDLPSLDRAADEGQLSAHRRFWGLAPASRAAGPGARRHSTVTELAFIAPMLRDGLYVLDLQIPAFLTDAAPSRPLLYRARFL